MNKKLKYYLTIFGLMISFYGFSQTDSGAKKWTLRECIDEAMNKSLSLRQSQLNLQDRKISLKESKFSLAPSLNAGGNYGLNWGRGIDPTSNDFINERIIFTGYTLSSSVNLFSGFQKQNTIKQNNLMMKASEKDFESERDNVTLDVISLYLNVIFNKELVNNSRLQFESTEKQLERTKILVEVGSLPVSNLLNLQSQLATNESNLINAENTLGFSTLNLKQALQIPSSDEFDVVIPELDVDKTNILGLDMEEVYRNALNNQPNIQSAELNVESSVRGEKIAKGARSPRLSLSGNLGSNYSDRIDRERLIIDGTKSEIVPIGFVEGTNQNVLTTVNTPNVIGTDNNYSIGEQFGDNFNQSLTFQLNIPIFNGYSTSSNIQRSKIQRQRAEITAKQVKQGLRQTIEQAYNDALAAAKNYDASGKQVAALEESFRMAKEQFDLGVINDVDYRIAENNFYQAKSDLVKNKYNYIFKTKILDFYQGKSLTF